MSADKIKSPTRKTESKSLVWLVDRSQIIMNVKLLDKKNVWPLFKDFNMSVFGVMGVLCECAECVRNLLCISTLYSFFLFLQTSALYFHNQKHCSILAQMRKQISSFEKQLTRKYIDADYDGNYNDNNTPFSPAFSWNNGLISLQMNLFTIETCVPYVMPAC